MCASILKIPEESQSDPSAKIIDKVETHNSSQLVLKLPEPKSRQEMVFFVWCWRAKFDLGMEKANEAW